jgi:hypothetical protein
MMREWRLEARGGAYDEWAGTAKVEPQPLLVIWVCSPTCDGHASFDVDEPSIVLKTAEVYRRTEVDLDERLAIYEVGDSDPARKVEERELVPAGYDEGIAYGLMSLWYRYGGQP